LKKKKAKEKIMFVKFMPKRATTKQAVPKWSRQNDMLPRFIPFWVSWVSSAYIHGFVPGPTLQGCSDDESLATCGRFDWLKIEPHTSRSKSVRLTTCAIWLVKMTILE